LGASFFSIRESSFCLVVNRVRNLITYRRSASRLLPWGLQEPYLITAQTPHLPREAVARGARSAGNYVTTARLSSSSPHGPGCQAIIAGPPREVRDADGFQALSRNACREEASGSASRGRSGPDNMARRAFYFPAARPTRAYLVVQSFFVHNGINMCGELVV